MKQFQLLNWVVEVDVEKTREFYRNEMEQCDCLYCENYRIACKSIDSSINDVFTSLGIQPAMPSHLSEFGDTEGLHLYIGHYHIVGHLIEGRYCTDSETDEMNVATIGNFTIWLEKELTFVHDELPRPVLQLAFEVGLPWVLSEKPED
ncbi:hypothetical protein [Bacillus sp. PS06]|uniref:hypothetical protein n=1 Tax=Bacillus sp. PS06 TaxID=2764176 RepID=UPI00177DAB28|nr:hypothetical protein [Bacillus sp. PS06]MBD8069584.1 hypothetical protein [Bacillus sp. PS06]